MIVYNLTIKVEHSIHESWLKWQREEHIPEIMATGMFNEFRFFQLLEQDEADGITYIMQYVAPDIEAYNRYIEEFAPILRKKANAKWGNRLMAFRTVMQSVH